MKTRKAVMCFALALALGVPPIADAAQGRGRRPGGSGDGRAAPPSAARAVPRGAAPPRAYMPPGPRPGSQVYGRGYYGRPAYYGGWGGARYYGVGRPVFARPYYSFRPYVNIGFGVWAGVPVPFPAFGVGIGVGLPVVSAYVGGYPPAYAAYPYPYPYGYGGAAYGGGYPVPVPSPYPVPYPVPSQGYGYGAQAPAGSVTAAPATPRDGGLSFEITPGDAVVYVDGAYAGPASSFGPSAAPLALSPGVHRIEIQAPGHQPLAFDVTISAGLVVPYRGSLTPGR